MLITVITGVMHVLWCYLFVKVAGMGVAGAGLAISTTNKLNLIMITGYITASGLVGEAWFCIGREAFSGLGTYLRFGLPCALVVLFDWGSLEITSLLVGYVGVNELAASVICANVFLFFYMFTQSLGFVTNAMVGNALGQGNKQNALTHARTGVAVAFGITVAIVLTISFTRRAIARIYTPNEAVQDLISTLLLIVAVNLCFDSMVAIGKSVIRGMGL